MIRIVVHDRQWFIDRIGKRIYREKNICDCEVCTKVYKEGLIITDEQHANYLYDCQELDLIYYDKKEVTNE
jgi:hypothetical protein